MSCYHPLVGVWRGEYTESGKKKYDFGNGSAVDPRFTGPIGESIVVPCGHCIGCRLDYSRKWADRMMLELETAKKAVMVTLTYDDNHAHATEYVQVVTDQYLPYGHGERLIGDELYIPKHFTLDKRDCQLFMKRVRRQFPNITVRFYLAGEYGDRTHRPHVHCILYGIDLDDVCDYRIIRGKKVLVENGKNQFDQKYYESSLLKKLWDYRGNVLCNDVSWQTCAYVARYVTKKVNGNMDKLYAELNCEKEFALMSRRPGIGAEYLDKHPDALDWVNINLSTPDGGRQIQVPKYYTQKLSLTDPERYDKMQKDRKLFAHDRLILKLQSTDCDPLEMLRHEEQKKISDVSIFKRVCV